MGDQKVAVIGGPKRDRSLDAIRFRVHVERQQISKLQAGLTLCGDGGQYIRRAVAQIKHQLVAVGIEVGHHIVALAFAERIEDEPVGAPAAFQVIVAFPAFQDVPAAAAVQIIIVLAAAQNVLAAASAEVIIVRAAFQDVVATSTNQLVVTVTAVDPGGLEAEGTFDLTIVVAEVFADGFESGDTSSWDATVTP